MENITYFGKRPVSPVPTSRNAAQSVVVTWLLQALSQRESPLLLNIFAGNQRLTFFFGHG